MFGWLKKNKEDTVKTAVVAPTFGITPSLKMIDEEKELLNMFSISFIEKISSSNEINQQKISEIKQLIEAELEPFERKSIKKTLNTGNPLTATQKKELGFNSRLKICENYLNFIDMNNINKIDPFEVLMDAEFYARARSWSIREINRAKSVGSKKVKLTVMEESCPKSVKVKKTYNIDDVPLLPLKTCGNRCLCMYTAVIEF